ncbi:MAG: cell division protein FtsW, partial [Leifsonia flava]
MPTDQTGVVQSPTPNGSPPTGPIRRIRLPQKMRNLELALLIFACALNAVAVVLVQFGALGHLDLTLVFLGAVLSALVVALHIVMRFVAREADPFLLPIATLLNGLGIAMIYRIDIADGHDGWDSAAVR